MAIDPITLQRHPVEPRLDVELAAVNASGGWLVGVQGGVGERGLVCWQIGPDLTFREVWRMRSNAAVIDQLVVAPDGQRFAVAEEALRQGVRVQERVTADGQVSGSVTVPVGSRLLGLTDGRVLLADERGELSAVVVAAKRVVSAAASEHAWLDAAIAPDGGSVLGVSSNGCVSMLDTDTLAVRQAYTLPTAGRPTCAAFAPDGLTAACGTSKGEVVIWDVD